MPRRAPLTHVNGGVTLARGQPDAPRALDPVDGAPVESMPCRPFRHSPPMRPPHRPAPAKRRPRRPAITAARRIRNAPAGPPSSRATSRAFCCAGCQAVAETLHAAGLDALYAGRTQSALRPEGDGDEWTRWSDVGRGRGLVRASARRAPRGVAAARRHDLRRLRAAARVVARPPAGRRRGARELRDPPRARRVSTPRATRLSAVLRAIAAVRLFGVSVRPRAPRGARAARAPRAARAHRRRAARDDAGDDVRAAASISPTTASRREQRRLLDWASFVLTLPALFYSARAAVRERVARPRASRASAWTCRSCSASRRRSRRARGRRSRGGGPVYFDSVTMFIALLLVARYLELVARQKAGRRDRGDRAPAAGHRRAAAAAGRAPGDARDRSRPPTLVAGDVVLVRPGALVPADGVDRRGPLARRGGDAHRRERAACRAAPAMPLWAGAVNRDNALVMRVTAAGEDTRLCRDPAPGRARRERAPRGRAQRRSHRRGLRRRSLLLLARRDRRSSWLCRRSVARAAGHVRRARRVVPVRALARHAGGARRRCGLARAARRRARARRCAGDARRRSRTSCSTRPAR